MREQWKREGNRAEEKGGKRRKKKSPTSGKTRKEKPQRGKNGFGKLDFETLNILNNTGNYVVMMWNSICWACAFLAT